MKIGIKFADGNEFLYYNDDTSHYDGCPTCDYGSEYINDISIETTNYIVAVKFNAMYDYAFSTAEAIRIFAAVDLKNMDEDDFIKYLDKEFHELHTPEFLEIKRKEELK